MDPSELERQSNVEKPLSGFFSAVSADNLDTVKQILDQGLVKEDEVMSCDEAKALGFVSQTYPWSSVTALMIALYFGSLDVCKFLAPTALRGSYNEGGSLGLHIVASAVEFGHLKIVKFLMNYIDNILNAFSNDADDRRWKKRENRNTNKREKERVRAMEEELLRTSVKLKYFDITEYFIRRGNVSLNSIMQCALVPGEFNLFRELKLCGGFRE